MDNIRKLQKPLFIIAFVFSAVLFFYTLGYSSSLYQLYYFGDPISASRYVPGAEIYSIVQPFNKRLLGFATIQIVLCVAMFLTLSYKRRIFYKSNYLTISAFSAFSVFNAIYIVYNNVVYRAQYCSIDFDYYKQVAEKWHLTYVPKSTLIFDLGFVLAALMLLVAAALVFVMLKKNEQRKSELAKATEAALEG